MLSEIKTRLAKSQGHYLRDDMEWLITELESKDKQIQAMRMCGNCDNAPCFDNFDECQVNDLKNWVWEGEQDG
jgi:hypothetical protein